MILYVAGPVLEDGQSRHEYSLLRIRGRQLGYDVDLPRREDALEDVDDDAFVQTIASRIERCDAIVTLLLPGDQSVPVEATLAALHNKPQLVLYDPVDGREPPRIIRGLPEIFDIHELRDLEHVLVHFLESVAPVEAPEISFSYETDTNDAEPESV